MKIAIVYASRSGNTRKLAEEIAAELGVVVQGLDKSGALPECDLLFVGCGCYAGNIPNQVRKALGQASPHAIKRIALFGTHGSSGHEIEGMKKALVSTGIPVIGTYSCGAETRWLLFVQNRGLPAPTDLLAVRQFARSAVAE